MGLMSLHIEYSNKTNNITILHVQVARQKPDVRKLCKGGQLLRTSSNNFVIHLWFCCTWIPFPSNWYILVDQWHDVSNLGMQWKIRTNLLRWVATPPLSIIFYCQVSNILTHLTLSSSVFTTTKILRLINDAGAYLDWTFGFIIIIGY